MALPLIADREADARLAREVQQRVRRAGRVAAQHDLSVLDHVAGELLKRIGEDGEVVAGVVGARVPGRSRPASGIPPAGRSGASR